MKRPSCLAACLRLGAACGQEASGPADEAAPAAKPAPAARPAPAAVADAEPPRFRYTRLTGCTLIRSAPEEAGFFEHECEGEGGYRLRHVESDLRENVIVLAPGGGEHSLELSALSRGAFNTLGDTVEWRGDSAAKGFVPTALILRHSAVEDPDPKVPEVSYLVVARLRPSPCVVARVPPGPGQNDRARELADAGGACLAG